MEQTKKSKKGILLAGIALVAVIVIMGGIFLLTRPATSTGTKDIVIEVVLADGSAKEFPLKTNAAYLRGVLEESKLASGPESEFGLWVTTVNGVTADESKQEWWCFTLNGTELTTGVDTTPVNDKDHFEATLKVGY